MKVLGIIAEYNPFHLGHAYHIEKAKELTGCDYVIAILSGSFTQAGNIAIYDKFTRAKLACLGGIDMVLELPTIYANASASHFAFGAVRILEQLGCISSLCFGSETPHIATLQKAASSIVQQENTIWNEISKNLEQGCSFASAREQALQQHIDSSLIAAITSPNNILGLEYLQALEQLQSKITPYLIERKGNSFHEKTLHTNAMYASATSIRNSIHSYHTTKKQEIKNEIKPFVPNSTWEIIENVLPTFNENFYPLLEQRLLTITKEDLATIQEVTEGLENRIIQQLDPTQPYEEWIQTLKSKRYQMSKIKRMLVNILLGIKKEDLNAALSTGNYDYAHILATSSKGKNLLPQLHHNANIPIITSLSDSIFSNLPKTVQHTLQFDLLATDLYSICHKDKIKRDYTNHL